MKQHYTDAYFTLLCKVNPDEALKYIDSNPIETYDLSFALEIASKKLPSKLILPRLLGYLTHPSSIVREGAIIGLNNFLDNEEVVNLLKFRLKEESSFGVRTVICDILGLDQLEEQ